MTITEAEEPIITKSLTAIGESVSSCAPLAQESTDLTDHSTQLDSSCHADSNNNSPVPGSLDTLENSCGDCNHKK